METAQDSLDFTVEVVNVLFLSSVSYETGGFFFWGGSPPSYPGHLKSFVSPCDLDLLCSVEDVWYLIHLTSLELLSGRESQGIPNYSVKLMKPIG